MFSSEAFTIFPQGPCSTFSCQTSINVSTAMSGQGHGGALGALPPPVAVALLPRVPPLPPPPLPRPPTEDVVVVCEEGCEAAAPADAIGLGGLKALSPLIAFAKPAAAPPPVGTISSPLGRRWGPSTAPSMRCGERCGPGRLCGVGQSCVTVLSAAGGSNVSSDQISQGCVTDGRLRFSLLWQAAGTLTTLVAAVQDVGCRHHPLPFALALPCRPGRPAADDAFWESDLAVHASIPLHGFR